MAVAGRLHCHMNIIDKEWRDGQKPEGSFGCICISNVSTIIYEYCLMGIFFINPDPAEPGYVPSLQIV